MGREAIGLQRRRLEGKEGQKAWEPQPYGAGMWKDRSEKAMPPLSLRRGRAHLGSGYI